MKILITSGGTKVPIDDVRHIGNMSSGRFASSVATEFLQSGHVVFFLHANGSKTPFQIDSDLANFEGFYNTNREVCRKYNLFDACSGRYTQIPYYDFNEYLNQFENLVSNFQFDAVISMAAVSDYGVDKTEGKISSSTAPSIQLKPLPKVINCVKELAPETKLVAFKLLVNATEEQFHNAANKVFINSKADLVVGNDLSEIKKGKHSIIIFNKNESGEVGGFAKFEGDLEKNIVDAVVNLR